MSLLKKVSRGLRAAAPLLSKMAPALGPIGIGASTLYSGYQALKPLAVKAGKYLPALPGGGVSSYMGAVGTVMKSPGVRKWTRRAAQAVGYTIIGKEVYDAAGNLVGEASGHRRVNPMNVRALRRAITRVKGARKICGNIEKIIPHKRSRRACAPARRSSCR